ncbi:MAG: hypothetical protein HY575_08875, partial [candidate division NC10 bacterium]|nr:hypothetical protein [candidate division NC10 bacterium]
MTCAQARERLRAEGPGKAARAHLEACLRCRQWWEAEQASERHLATALRSVPAPPALLGRILAAVERP